MSRHRFEATPNTDRRAVAGPAGRVWQEVLGLPPVSSPDPGRVMGGKPGRTEPRADRAGQAPDDRHHRDRGPPSCGRHKSGIPKEAPGSCPSSWCKFPDSLRS